MAQESPCPWLNFYIKIARQGRLREVFAPWRHGFALVPFCICFTTTVHTWSGSSVTFPTNLCLISWGRQVWRARWLTSSQQAQTLLSFVITFGDVCEGCFAGWRKKKRGRVGKRGTGHRPHSLCSNQWYFPGSSPLQVAVQRQKSSLMTC